MSFTITKHQAVENNEYEIEGEIHADVVKTFRDQAVKELGLETRVDGFRPGHIPEKIIVDRFGEAAITEEAGRIALEKHYGEILDKAIAESKIKPLGSPAVSITKTAPGEAFGFKIKTALMPEVSIKDYKAIAKKTSVEIKDIEVTEKEIDEAIEDLRKQVAHTQWHEKNKDKEGHNHAGHDDAELPEVNQEFISKFGPFENIEAFRTKIKESMSAEKARKEKEKNRLAIMEALLAKAEIKMPKMLVESELSKMLNELSSNISQMGLNLETYLKHLGKTLEEMKAEWTPDAEKRAKTQLILSQIAIDEKITVDEADVKKEVDQIMQYYKDADPVRAAIYVEMMLLNDKVWTWLESQK
jgi:FKBP-type peptidyl-prolyl cis-trans isomerase (trigger factor)